MCIQSVLNTIKGLDDQLYHFAWDSEVPWEAELQRWNDPGQTGIVGHLSKAHIPYLLLSLSLLLSLPLLLPLEGNTLLCLGVGLTTPTKKRRYGSVPSFQDQPILSGFLL